MHRNNPQEQSTNGRRQSLVLPVFPIDESHPFARQLSATMNVRNRSVSASQSFLLNGNEYRSQERIPPAGADIQRQRIYSRVEESVEPVNQRRLSIISEVSYPLDHQESRSESTINDALIRTRSDERRRRILFIVEPIIVGFIILPIVALFWECGWNIVWILLNTINGYPSTSQFDQIPSEELRNYSLQSLLVPYLVVQILLLIFYLSQDFFYDFLKRQNQIITIVLLKIHIFLLATIYIIQWETLWIVWDQYIPRDWYFELVLSLTSLFALIVFIGHLSDLVCAPFLVSYDSIEYCLHFGCPLLTRQVSLFICFHN